MSNSGNSNANSVKTSRESPITVNEVDTLAARALSMVAARAARNIPGTRDSMTDRLLEAAMGRSKETYRGVARHMLSMGIAPEYIVDEYIPAVARRMGDEWCDDTSSFAAVTIGGTRLQALLRELSTFWKADDAKMLMDSKASAIVLVPPHAQHTLGAGVLSTQLRRMGLSVRLSIGTALEDLSDVLRDGAYDSVFISASNGDTLDNVRKLIDTVRSVTQTQSTPLIVGGTVLEQDIDVGAAVGADLATADLFEALEFCNIATSRGSA